MMTFEQDAFWSLKKKVSNKLSVYTSQTWKSCDSGASEVFDQSVLD